MSEWDTPDKTRGEKIIDRGDQQMLPLMEALADAVVVVEPNGVVRYANPAAESLFGRDRSDLLGQPLGFSVFGEATAEVQIIRPGGDIGFAEMRTVVSEWERKKVHIVCLRDITGRKRAEEALKASEEKYRLLVEMASEAVYVIQNSRIKFHNKQAERTTGYTADELNDMPALNLVHPEDREWVLKRYEARMQGGDPPSSYELRLVHKNGQEICAYIEVVIINWEGQLASLNFLRDITAEKGMESQVRQLQKLEALGRLAGGVAHDFNNILTTIIGNAEIALTDIGKDHPLREDIEEIRKAGNRGASLTRQLLAFSRKQIVEPTVLDLNDLLRNLEKMLCRMIGEDVALEMTLMPTLGKIQADPGQMEQVFMNLAVNARDAMPRGGSLSIHTDNVYLDETYGKRHPPIAPGFYVMAAVSDTGKGMDEQVKAHLFEPFFTTKEEGKGTGLGLSTVYGIVKQAHGHIHVYSEAGKGTTLKIYLPHATEAQQPARTEFHTQKLIGTETILVVEDEEHIRQLTQKILARYGYSVLEAENGAAALACLDPSRGAIHLALIDLVLPDMSGPEVAGALRARLPTLKVLYTSGYTEDVIRHHGVLKPGFDFIPKPFVMDDLVLKVRTVLDRDLSNGIP